MIEEISVQRLDYSKPPPGYEVSALVGPARIAPGWYVYSEPTKNAVNLGAPFYGEDEALERAWSHYKAGNDPPGLEVMDDGLFGWGFQVLRMRTWPTPGTRPVREFHSSSLRSTPRSTFRDS